MNDIETLARNYIEFFNRLEEADAEISNFVSPEIVWQEMPNRYAPQGRTVDYETLKKNFREGQKFVKQQVYKVKRVIVQGDTAVVQIDWAGTVSQDLGPIAAGTQLTAQIASFIQFQDGKVISQTDYPCYPPFDETTKSN